MIKANKNDKAVINNPECKEDIIKISPVKAGPIMPINVEIKLNEALADVNISLGSESLTMLALALKKA